jgi:transcriptional regulator with PAS, ATPase and Fis domain
MEACVGNETISAPIRMPSRVVALRERDRSERFELASDERRWVIGKAPSCDLVIADPYVSNLHCMLERRHDGELIMRDCDSKNGTLIDGAPVLAVPLRPGAVIVIGKTYLVAIGSDDTESALLQLRGRDVGFRVAVDLALRAARSECSVLVLGETGTGKELIARAIHEASRRAAGPLVAVNCGAFPPDLIGSELFGHSRGAFTGAVDAHDGVFVAADGGTLFLDELGELPRDLQPHLLRALETRRVRPLGSNAERSVDVRFVAATNRLDIDAEQSPLRFDLYQRVAAVTVTLPPLRKRRGDIPELAQVFLDELAHDHGPRELRPAALDALLHHSWPGNVRELRQTIHRAVAMTVDEIDIDDLILPTAVPSLPRLVDDGRGRHSMVMREMMAQALSRRGTIRAAARELGIPKSTFAEKARRFGLLGQDREE